MEIKNRLFSYPVLCNETDDYVEGIFHADVKKSQTLHEINLSISINLENHDLKSLIRDGFAQYVIHIECSSTSYREIIKTSSDSVHYSIKLSKLKGEIQILSMLVAENL